MRGERGGRGERGIGKDEIRGRGERKWDGRDSKKKDWRKEER